MRSLGDAFDQRLAGSYYGLTGYRAEHLFTHVVGMHKPVMALWSTHTAVCEALFGPNAQVRLLPSGFWHVSHGLGPA